MRNLIQVAGILDFNEALMLIKSGVTHLGFPLRLPVHKEDISEEECSLIVSELQKFLRLEKFSENNIGIPKFVIVTYINTAEEAIELCLKVKTDIIQLHGEIKIDELSKLRKSNPEIEIIKSIVIKNDNLGEYIELVNQFEQFVDYFITDTFDPVTGASGATGMLHNWDVSKEIVKISTKPVILAGGLNEKNISDAINYIKPFGVDAHTGLENSLGRKDKKKVLKFVQASNKAFKLLT